MNEKLIKFLASISRNTPHFKGKYRIGLLVQKLLNSSNNWNEPEFFIQLKNETELYIDIRSGTHKVPFWTGRRDQTVIDLIQKMMPQNAVIFDIGANIGYYAIPLAYHLKRKSVIVHAFEPVNSNYKSLEFAIERNHLTNVKANKIALGAEPGNIEIVLTEAGNSGNAVLSFNDNEFENNLIKETIPMTTLDLYMEKANLDRCDFIKIDIEGAEIFFFQGGLKFIEKFKPIIYGEFNSYFLKKFGFTIIDIWKLIEPMGYTVYVENKARRGKFKKIEIKDGMEDLLLLPPNETNIEKWITN